jgi:hypothetical protein
MWQPDYVDGLFRAKRRHLEGKKNPGGPHRRLLLSRPALRSPLAIGGEEVAQQREREALTLVILSSIVSMALCLERRPREPKGVGISARRGREDGASFTFSWPRDHTTLLLPRRSRPRWSAYRAVTLSGCQASGASLLVPQWWCHLMPDTGARIFLFPPARPPLTVARS